MPDIHLSTQCPTNWRLRQLGLRFVLGCAAVLAGCTATAPNDEVPEGYNVLFIGNSLTYMNNLPLMVEYLVPTVGGEVGRTQSPAPSRRSHRCLHGLITSLI